MTDRELLELAAKAAGMDCIWEGDGDFINQEDRLPWTPRTDDGDALRLLISLLQHGKGVHLDIYRSSITVRIDPENTSQIGARGTCWTKYAPEGVTDVYEIGEAACLAILRAAAEIGKEMK